MGNSVDHGYQQHRAQVGKWVLVVLAVVLAIVTIYSLRNIDRFFVEKEQLLVDPQFLSGKAHWEEQGSSKISTSGNQLVITNNLGASHSVFQTVAVEPPAFYRFDFDAGVKDVVPTREDVWAKASAAVVFYDKNGERRGSTTIAYLEGSQAIKSYSENLLIRESASIEFAFRLFSAGGEFMIANPVISRLQEFPFYKNVRIAIVVAWLLFSGLLLFLLWRLAGAWNLLALIALCGAALVGVMMPEAMMSAVNQKIAGLLPQIFFTESRRLLGFIYEGNKFISAGSEVSKVGHFIVFTLLGVFAGLRWKKVGIFFALACIAVFAFVTEALQMLVNGRMTSVGDLITDIVGGIIGLAIGVALLWCFQAMRRLVKKPDQTPEEYSANSENFDENY